MVKGFCKSRWHSLCWFTFSMSYVVAPGWAAEMPTGGTVTSNFTSNIAGRLTADGRVLLINPNGILFTRTAQVNTGSFMASTLDIKDEDFINGNPLSALIDNSGSGYISAGSALCIPEYEKGIDCNWLVAEVEHDVKFYGNFDGFADVVDAFEKVSLVASLAMKQAVSSVTQQLNDSAMINNELQEKFSYVLTGTTMVLSHGFLGWILKTGVLLASILSILPMWARFDPLPVLNLSPEQREDLKIALNKSREEERLKYKSMATLLDKYDPLPNEDDLDNSIEGV